MPFFHFSFSKKLQICWNFSKSVKTNFDEHSQLGQKITKFQNLCRTPINFFLKHTIVHETKFHSFFAKQIFWALSSDTFWHFEHSDTVCFFFRDEKFKFYTCWKGRLMGLSLKLFSSWNNILAPKLVVFWREKRKFFDTCYWRHSQKIKREYQIEILFVSHALDRFLTFSSL